MFDWNRLRKLVQHDEELLKELIETYLESADEMLASVRSALEGDDPVTLRRATHTLAGSMRILGTEESHRRARELEVLAREGELDSARPLFEQLCQDTAEMCREFRRYMAQADD